MPFFSIIMPAHNVADFIQKALDSIQIQTFKDYELIVVCDNCNDNTAEIARRYTDKVYEINVGYAGGARNVGLDNATGEWILFIDADDWYLHNYVFSMLYEVLIDLKQDVLTFSFIANHYGYATGGLRWPAVWNKVWRRNAIEKGPFRFPLITVAEDFEFAKAIYPHITAMNWDMPLYYYNYMRPESLSWHKLQGKVEEGIIR